MKQDKLDQLIKEIAARNTGTAITLSIREIQELVKKETGETPNAIHIASALRTSGLDIVGKRRGWFYRHNAPKADE